MPKHMTVNEYLLELTPEGLERTNKLRAIIKKAIPDITEKVDSWGHLSYTHGDKPISWMINYDHHTNFGFTFGAHLDSDRLEGTGKNFRHIKIRSFDDIDEAEFTQLLRNAAQLKLE